MPHPAPIQGERTGNQPLKYPFRLQSHPHRRGCRIYRGDGGKARLAATLVQRTSVLLHDIQEPFHALNYAAVSRITGHCRLGPR